MSWWGFLSVDELASSLDVLLADALVNELATTTEKWLDILRSSAKRSVKPKGWQRSSENSLGQSLWWVLESSSFAFLACRFCRSWQPLEGLDGKSSPHDSRK